MKEVQYSRDSDAVDAQHLNPETKDQYESRYKDSPHRIQQWS